MGAERECQGLLGDVEPTIWLVLDGKSIQDPHDSRGAEDVMREWAWGLRNSFQVPPSTRGPDGVALAWDDLTTARPEGMVSVGMKFWGYWHRGLPSAGRRQARTPSSASSFTFSPTVYNRHSYRLEKAVSDLAHPGSPHAVSSVMPQQLSCLNNTNPSWTPVPFDHNHSVTNRPPRIRAHTCRHARSKHAGNIQNRKMATERTQKHSHYHCLLLG